MEARRKLIIGLADAGPHAEVVLSFLRSVEKQSPEAVPKWVHFWLSNEKTESFDV